MSADLTLPRSSIGADSFLADEQARYTGIAIESLTTHQFVGAFVKLRKSIGVVGETDKPLALPAGRYRLHLVSDNPTAAASLRITGAQPQRLVVNRPSPVKSALSPLAVANAVAAGRFTGNIKVKPGGLTLLAYRAQALAVPAGVVDLALYDDTGVSDPNGLFPAAGFGPLPFASTFTQGAEALVFALLQRSPKAPDAAAYRQEVNVAAAAVQLRNSEVFTLVTG